MPRAGKPYTYQQARTDRACLFAGLGAIAVCLAVIALLLRLAGVI